MFPAPWSGSAEPSGSCPLRPSCAIELDAVRVQPQRPADPPDQVRAHPVFLDRQPMAHVLKAEEEGHVTDGDVCQHPALLPGCFKELPWFFDYGALPGCGGDSPAPSVSIASEPSRRTWKKSGVLCPWIGGG